jgi:rhamnogalacturonyl hydrolase YesR
MIEISKQLKKKQIMSDLYFGIPRFRNQLVSFVTNFNQMKQSNFIDYIRKYSVNIVFICLLLSANIVSAQNNAEGRIPKYPVPYGYPSVDGIKETLNQIRVYYESTSSVKIIDSETGKEITDFSKPNKNACVSPGFAAEWSYTNGVVLSAFDYIDDVTGDPVFFKNNTSFFDKVVETLPYFIKNYEEFGKEAKRGWGRTPDFEALDDCGSIGAAMIKTYQKNKNEDYLELINTIADYISNGQFRLNDGTLARNRPQYESIWADDLYMSVPFLANMGVLSGDNKYFDDAVKQILQMAKRLYVPQKELFDHGWNVTSGDYDPYFFWGRANGWTLMSMVELLDVLPSGYKGRDEVLHLYRSMIRSLAGLQDGTGFWHNMLDKTDTYLETSCTAMFTYAIAKGINEGWINHVYGPVALTGWNALKTKVLENGAVDGTCEGTTFAHDNTYYYNRGKSIYATHGYGPVLYAGAEMIRLLKNDKIRVDKARPNSRNSTYHFKLKSEWPNK